MKFFSALIFSALLLCAQSLIGTVHRSLDKRRMTLSSSSGCSPGNTIPNGYVHVAEDKILTSQPIDSMVDSNSMGQLLPTVDDVKPTNLSQAMTALLNNSNTEPSPVQLDETAHRILPCGDALDKRIFAIFIPAVLNYILIPLTGAVDCFWVGRMKDALALAGQSGANQMFASAFFLSSFLPAVVSPLVASARNNEEVQDRCHQAMWVALIVGSIASSILFFAPRRVLSTVLPLGSPSMAYALPYLRVRSLTLLPSLLSTVAFAVFRGSLDIVTPLRIAVISNVINILLDPILMFPLKMGVAGAAAATCAADLVSFFMYLWEMRRRKMFDTGRFLSGLPTIKQLAPLLAGGLSIQVRAFAIEFAFLAVSRATQTDATGHKGAAHAVTVQLWQLGSVILLAMSTAGSTLVPSEVVKLKRASEEGGKSVNLESARRIANRVMVWGGLLGLILGVGQLCALPIVAAFSEIEEVQRAARLPVMISALLQVINGVTFTGEGIQQVGWQCSMSSFHLYTILSEILILSLLSPSYLRLRLHFREINTLAT